MDYVLLEKIISDGIAKNIKDINHNKVYKIHKYWSRKPWSAIADNIKKYSKPNDLICDPFLGSGVMGLESILNGRNFIGYDINPISIFISKSTLNYSFDFEKIEKDFEKIKYFTKNNVFPYYISSEICNKCNNPMYFKYINDGKKFSYLSGRIYCIECGNEDKKYDSALSKKDILLIEKINNSKIPFDVPKQKFPKKFYKDRFSYKGIFNVTDIHTRRNLICLSILFNEIKTGDYFYKDLLLIAFSNTILHCSKLKGTNVRPLSVNNYWIPDDHIEENVGFRFLDRYKIAIESKKSLSKIINDNMGEAHIYKKSALDKKDIYFDYIITDPPYGDVIQYSELSYVWNSWLDQDFDINEEIIINPMQNKNEDTFHDLISISLDNIYSSLKDGKYFTLCFQNKNIMTWKKIILKCKELGFDLIDVSVYDVLGSPYNKNWSKFSPKSDIYVTFKKGKNNNVKAIEPPQINESIFKIIDKILEYFAKEKIKLESNNHIYDVIVSYIIWHMYRSDISIDRNLTLKDIFLKFGEKYEI